MLAPSLVTLLILQSALARSTIGKHRCGYESCPEPKGGFINLHLVPHTHDDVGWLKTVDQYYYGSRNNIQDAGVQYILDSVVQELLHDPSKRFIYVETAFFWKWWQEQSDTMRHQVQKLVNNGQLEFIGGAWSMHDEATTHYQSIIEDFTWGFRRLSDTFGKCGRPKVGWQIDPFGHSRESASIMAHMGFDGLFLGRIDWQDKEYRLAHKTPEMLWYTSANDKSNASQLFTSVMYNTYSAPRGFCFDVNCDDEPIIDNKHSTEYNAPRKAAEFIEIMKNYSRAYQTNNILVTMGEDFMYMNAHINYKNMDKLIEYVNKQQLNGSQFNAFYSTPSCYLKAVHDSGITLPTKSDDFMPYSSDPMSFWTGYFTSRPTLKYFERLGNNFLQVCKQLYALADLGPEDKGDLIAMREAMGVMQHHDAITGTEKQHVAYDYARILTEGINECSIINEAALNKLMPKTSKAITTESCLLLNISSCPLTEDENNFIVTIYNPLSRNVDRLVRIPTPSYSLHYDVLCPMGRKQEVQLIPLPDEILNLPGRNSNAKAELVFLAKNLPPLGFRSYYVSRSNEIMENTEEIELKDKSIKIGYDKGASVTIDKQGHLKTVEMYGQEIDLVQKFYYYNSAVGNNEEFKNRSSGAYIFRPNGSEILLDDQPKVKIFKGTVVSEIQQKFNDWISQVIRVYKNSSHVEFQWMVGPIPISEQNGREIITRFETKIKNNGEFLTDSNGREFLTRKLNYRPTWSLKLAEKIPGNYYPLTTAISITDGTNRVSVVTDRAQGGTSLNDGEIEIMVHRRLIHDDAFGVGEALNETAYGVGLVTRGSHYLTNGNITQVRHLMQEKVLNSWLFFSKTNGLSFNDWKNMYNMQHSGLKHSLPPNVQILTLEPWSGKSFLLRLEHIMEKTDDDIWSLPATVDLKKLFHNWHITLIEEMMLGANIKIEESERLVWKTDKIKEDISVNPRTDDLPQITLQPMQIRTFVIGVNNA